MSDSSKAKASRVSVRVRQASDDSSETNLALKPASLKSPRTARFAEATAVNSPIEPSRNPFKAPGPEHFMPEPQVADVGFGYVNKHNSVEMPNTENPPLTARTIPKSPLKSAMKTPGAPPRELNLQAILSPTYREEQLLEKREQLTELEQARDLKVKTRVRMAKFLLKGVNFGCSLVVISMLAATFTIFEATKAIPPRNNLPPWALGQKKWPQILLLVIASISLITCIGVFVGYWRGGHKRAEKAAVYYSAFTVCTMVFSLIMWAVGAAVLQTSKNNSNNKDMWGWSCVQNERRELFQRDVKYELICRMQNWSLLCSLIEVVIETMTIAIYVVVFYRIQSKRKLRKSMAARDKARSDLYLATLKSQSQPNTPAPFSPRDGGYRPQPGSDYFKNAAAVEEGDVQYVDADRRPASPQPFKLQAPPIRVTNATPKIQQMGFTPVETAPRERTPSPLPEQAQISPLYIPETPGFRGENQLEHFDIRVPGEQEYAAVPIPGAYEGPQSPSTSTFPPMR